MKDQPNHPTPAPEHQFAHEVPTVIHHPEEDMTILARWLARGMEQGAKFWILLGGVVLAVVAVSLLASSLAAGHSAADKAWLEMARAKTPGELVEVAEAYPNTAVERWAKYQAALQFYSQAFTNLPDNRDAALPQLQNALKRFEEVVAEAPRDEPVARAAALGRARTLEVMNELEKAKEAYRAVAQQFPDTPEAARAEALAKQLEQPEAAEFYKKLYAYTKPETPALPAPPAGVTSPGGLGRLPLPSGGLSDPASLATPPTFTPPAGKSETSLPALDDAPAEPTPAPKKADAPLPPESPADRVLPPGASPKG